MQVHALPLSIAPNPKLTCLLDRFEAALIGHGFFAQETGSVPCTFCKKDISYHYLEANKVNLA